MSTTPEQRRKLPKAPLCCDKCGKECRDPETGFLAHGTLNLLVDEFLRLPPPTTDDSTHKIHESKRFCPTCAAVLKDFLMEQLGFSLSRTEPRWREIQRSRGAR